MSEVEAGLAEFALRTRWSELPGTVRQRTVDLVLDAIACAYTGRLAAGRASFADATFALAGSGPYTVIADSNGASLLGAGMLNAWQVTATTMCDVYRPAMCHVTPIVLAATLAGADLAPASVEDFLSAFAIGVEVTLRLCAAMDGALYRGPRWHAPGVIGPFGSAAAFGRMLGVDDATLREAWGAALLHSAGTFSAIGTPGVKLTQARGAAAGLQAVIYARSGHGGSANAFSHPDGGLFDAYAGLSPESVLDGLGETWLSSELSLRQWPASSSLQSLIAAVLDLRAAHGADGAHGSPTLIVELPRQSYKLCGEMPWDRQLSALQSAAWVAAAAWTDGRCWLDQFEPDGLRDGRRNALARRVRVTEDPSLPEGAARVRLDGIPDAVAERIDAPGSPADPLSAAAIRDKLALGAGESRAADLVRLLAGSPASVRTADLLDRVRRED
jgi:2-methylcitrate dehydratase PrpD